MKKYSVIFLFAAMGLLAGCVKENAPEAPEAGKATLDVSITPVSKTYMGEAEAGKRKVYWAEGDAINVNGNDSQPLESTAAGTQKATFHFDTPVSAPFNLFYPAGIATDPTHVTLPAIQTYKADSFADGMFPMAGYSADGSSIALKHLCAVMKVNVKRSSAAAADEDRLVAVSFQGKSDEQVSGSFAVDFAAATLTGASSAEADKVVRVNKVLVTSTTEAVSYYVVVPAIEYAAGFKLVIQDESAHTMTLNVGAKTLEVGKLYDLTEATFTPNGSVDGIEIASAQDLIDFATAYNAKTYEALGGALVVEVVDNIAFDAITSAAFNATGGIGLKKMNGDAEDYYFSGSFKGNDHTISGLEATVPIFKATEDDGIVKDLTISSTCSFTFTHPNANEIFFGSVVGYHKGLLENVSVAADVALEPVADVEYMTSLGGLVGRATVGQLEGCEYAGLISTPAGFTATPPADDPNTRKLIIGGLVGRFSNAGSLSGSYFKGAISNEAQIQAGDADNRELKDNPYLIIGGVVGYLGGGATVSSTQTTADHATIQTAYSGATNVGHIVNKSTVAYNSATGGIVGELNKGIVSNCTNAASVFNTVYKDGNKDVNGRYMYTGGIVGKIDKNGSVTGCTNNAKVQHRSNPKMQYLGGIAGYNAGALSSCSNTAAVNQMTSGQTIKAGRQVRLGGVIGFNASSATVSDVHNSANLEISSMEDATASAVYLGGVVADNAAAMDGGATKNITNSGQVYFSPTMTTQFEGYYLGGIAGLTTASIKNAKNVGRPYFRWQGTGFGASKVHLGGIAGKASGASSAIESCENTVDAGVSNSAQVYLYLPGNASYSGNCVGGIVGLTEATDPVKNCTNGGEVRTASGSSTVPVTDIKMGGIIGKMTGSGTVDNADNGGRVRINFGVAEEGHSGNYIGGIIGYISNEAAVTVTGCDNSGQVDITNGAGLVQDHIASGVVGRMDAPGSITSCNNNGGAIQMLVTANSVGPKDLYCAGVLGYSESGVTLSGCSNTGAISGGNTTKVDGTAYYTGGIVAYLKGASKILDCSNTGSTVSTHAGNIDTIGSTSLTGGIAGYVEGISEHPIEIGGTSGCTVNTAVELSATRGWIGGVAAYAKYAQISNCTIDSIIGGGCAARGAGGIVGKAEYCDISASSYNGNTIKANQIQATTGQGGIVGNLDNSTIDGCYCYATSFLNNNSQPFGGIVGISVSNNTIQNCHYKSAVEGPTAGTAVTATIVASGDYTDGGGNVADL